MHLGKAIFTGNYTDRLSRLPRPLRLLFPYVVSLASLAIPVTLTAALYHHSRFLPLLRFAFLLDVAAVSWWAGFWAGMLVTFSAAPVLLFIVTGGRVVVPHRLDPASIAVMILVVVLASQISAAQKRAEALLRSANRELDERVRQRTAELDRAHESLKITLASIGDAVIATDTQGRITLLNAVAETLTGWLAEEAIGRPLSEIFRIINADTRAAVESPVDRVLRTGITVGLANHTLLIGRHGREIPIDDSGAPIRSADGQIAGVVLIFRDIAERYRAESARQKLLEADERLVGILTNINDGFLVVDRHWQLTFLNNKVSDLVQRPCEELLGTTLWQALPSIVGTPAEVEMLRAMRENVPVRCVFQYEPLRVWFDAGAYPSGDGLALLIRDVTENQRLEGQLRQAQKMEAVGRLAGGIAHDFNNLLTVINGYAEYALQEIPSDFALRDSINQILLAGRRAAELTNGLLTFSRKSVRQPAVLKINDTIRATEKMLRRLVGEDIEIVPVLGENLWEIEADRSQLEQIVVNLAANARDAMPKGGVLTIETSNAYLDSAAGQRLGLPPGPYTVLAVTDTGHGMDAATQSHMFEPFFTTKGPGHGTGLGLSTVYGIVKQSGGAISVYSERDRGTSFKIFFPNPKSAASSPDLPATEPPILAPRGRRRSVLVVEDEDSVRRLALTILERHGFRVLQANSGYEALEVCRAEGGNLDLVLTDIVMPQMSGEKLAVELRQLYPALNVVFMSGYAEHAVVNQALLAPDVHFLRKPFTTATLLGKVNQALSSSNFASGGAC